MESQRREKLSTKLEMAREHNTEPLRYYLYCTIANDVFGLANFIKTALSYLTFLLIVT